MSEELLKLAAQYDELGGQLERVGRVNDARGVRRVARELRFSEYYGSSGQDLAKRIESWRRAAGSIISPLK